MKLSFNIRPSSLSKQYRFLNQRCSLRCLKADFQIVFQFHKQSNPIPALKKQDIWGSYRTHFENYQCTF